MKTFKIMLVCMLFGLYTSVSAQITYNADPFNYVAVANQIHADNGLLSVIPVGDLENHLDAVVNTATHDPNSVPPALVIDEISPERIKVSWTGFPTSTYEVSYINLYDGTSVTQSVNGSEFVEFTNPTVGLYVISIVKLDIYGVTWLASSGNIIIKEIMQFVDLTPAGSCSCQEDLLSEVNIILDYVPGAPSYGILNFGDIYNPETDGHTKYKVVVTAFGSDAGEKVTYIQRPFVSQNMFFVTCNEDFNIEAATNGDALVLADENNGNAVYGTLWMYPSVYGVVIGSFPNLSGGNGIGKVSIIKCGGGEESERSKIQGDIMEQPLQVFPNPASDIVKIKSQSNDRGVLTITNQLGQVIFTKKGAFNEEEVWVQDWPKGMYYVTMTVNGLTTKESFAKIDY